MKSNHFSITTTILRSHISLTLKNNHLSTKVTILGSQGWTLYKGLPYSQIFLSDEMRSNDFNDENKRQSSFLIPLLASGRSRERQAGN